MGILKLMEAAERPHGDIPLSRWIALMRQAVDQDPANPLLYYSLGTNYEKAGRHADAMKMYQTALQRGIVSARLHSRIADLLVRAGKKPEAIAEYKKSAQLNPADLDNQANLATAYLETGRLSDAERVYKAISTIDPFFSAAYNGLGVIAIQKQDGVTARGSFEKAARSGPDGGSTQSGAYLQNGGDRTRARTCFETFLAKASPGQYGQVISKVREELAGLQ